MRVRTGLISPADHGKFVELTFCELPRFKLGVTGNARVLLVENTNY